MSGDESGELLTLRCARRVDRKAVRRLLGELVSKVTGGRGFTVLLTDDRELRRLNRQFLGKDYPTDVLSFPSREGEGGLGEMAISVERAEEQALRWGHSLEEEIGILMLHGALHLMGMDHEKDAGEMGRAEAKWRRRLGLAAGLTERSGG